MKRSAIMLAGALAFYLAPALYAQDYDHAEVGIFANYFRVSQLGNLNQVGLGGRAGFNVRHNVKLEGEMAWDFNQGFTESCSGCLPVQTARSGVRILHGLFGPALEGGTHSAKVFVTLKGGFVNFRFSPEPGTFGNFASDVQALRFNNSNAALYPGGGIKLFAGPFGFRVDVGDEIYFRDGAHHNLRIAGGPVIRF